MSDIIKFDVRDYCDCAAIYKADIFNNKLYNVSISDFKNNNWLEAINSGTYQYPSNDYEGYFRKIGDEGFIEKNILNPNKSYPELLYQLTEDSDIKYFNKDNSNNYKKDKFVLRVNAYNKNFDFEFDTNNIVIEMFGGKLLRVYNSEAEYESNKDNYNEEIIIMNDCIYTRYSNGRTESLYKITPNYDSNGYSYIHFYKQDRQFTNNIILDRVPSLITSLDNIDNVIYSINIDAMKNISNLNSLYSRNKNSLYLSLNTKDYWCSCCFMLNVYDPIFINYIYTPESNQFIYTLNRISTEFYNTSIINGKEDTSISIEKMIFIPKDSQRQNDLVNFLNTHSEDEIDMLDPSPEDEDSTIDY